MLLYVQCVVGNFVDNSLLFFSYVGPFFKVSIFLCLQLDFSSIFIVIDVTKDNFLESRLSLSFIVKSLQLSISKPVKTEQNSHWSDRPLIIRYMYVYVHTCTCTSIHGRFQCLLHVHVFVYSFN